MNRPAILLTSLISACSADTFSLEDLDPLCESDIPEQMTRAIQSMRTDVCTDPNLKSQEDIDVGDLVSCLGSSCRDEMGKIIRLERSIGLEGICHPEKFSSNPGEYINKTTLERIKRAERIKAQCDQLRGLFSIEAGAVIWQRTFEATDCPKICP